MSEINYQQILALSKTNLNEENYLQSDMFVNLFFSGNCKDISSILAAYSYQSYNYTKINFSFNLHSLIQNSISYLSKVLQDTDTSYCLVKILYRLSNFLFKDQSNFFHSIYLVDKCNYLFEKTFLKKTQADSFSVLQDLEVDIRKEILVYIYESSEFLKESSRVNLIKEICKNVPNNSYLIEKINNLKLDSTSKFRQCKKLESQSNFSNNAMNEFNDQNMIINIENEKNTFNDSNNDQDSTSIEKENNQLFYIISRKYFERLCKFIENNINLREPHLLDLDNILKEYLKNSRSNDLKEKNIESINDENKANQVHPGPIDNLDLIDFKASWDIFLDKQNYYNSSRYFENKVKDQGKQNKSFIKKDNIEESEFNNIKERVALKPNLQEKLDFLYLELDDYMTIKEVFDSNYDIPRYYKPKYKEIECYYHNIDLLILSPKFRKSNYCNLISIKNTQFSKESTYENFVERIKLIYLNALGGDYLSAGLEILSTLPLKLYLVEKKSFDMFELSLFFIKNQDSYDIDACQNFNEEIFNNMFLEKQSNAYNEFCIISEFEGIDFISNSSIKQIKNICSYCNSNFNKTTTVYKCQECNQVNIKIKYYYSKLIVHNLGFLL
jgi:hypothetical protein